MISRTTLLRLAQGAWIVLAVFSAVVFFLDIPSYYHHAVTLTNTDGFITHNVQRWQHGLHVLGLSRTFYADYLLSIQFLVAVSVFLTGTVIFARRSQDWMALLVSATLVIGGALLPGPAFSIGNTYPLLGTIALNVALGGILGLVALTYLFPTGRFVPGWGRWALAAWVFGLYANNLAPGTIIDSSTWPKPIVALAGAILVLSCVVAPIYRYRRVSDQFERQQTKWVMTGLVLTIVTLIIVLGTQQLFPGLVRPDVNAVLYDLATITLFGAAFSLLPVFFGIAIFRYHLWDVDRIINRTLVYASLTVSLALMYVGIVIVVEALLRALTGQGSQLAIAIATLSIAALFNPWHRRLQAFIDRRFYRQRYDATRVLTALQGKLRDEVDLDELSDEILAAVQETVQPAALSLWLVPTIDEARHLAATGSS